MSVELLERAIARLEELKAGATGNPSLWYWYDYGKSGKTLAALNPIPGAEGIFGGQAYGHDLNVLKTVDDWPPTKGDAALIVTLASAIDPILAMLRRNVVAIRSAIESGMSVEYINEVAERAGDLALARAILGEDDDNE